MLSPIVKLISLYNYSIRSTHSNFHLPYGLGVLTAFLRENDIPVLLEDFTEKIQKYNSRHTLTFSKRINLNMVRCEKEILDYSKGLSLSKPIDILAEKLFCLTQFDDCMIVGFSVTTYFHFLLALLLTKKIKHCYSMPVVLGGPFITLYGKKLFDHYTGDYMIVGSGQTPLLKLIMHVQGQCDIDEIPNLIFRKNKQVCENSYERFPIDMQAIPDFSDLSYSFYATGGEKLVLPYQINEGCWHRCNFCTEHLFNPSVCSKNHSKVVAEIKEMKDRYKSTLFYFCDQTVNISYSYLDKLCDLFVEEELDIMWGAYARADNLDRKLLAKMKKAGCGYLVFGVESGSNRMLQYINKRSTVEQISQVLSDSYLEGIQNVVLLVYGFPYETDRDIEETCLFIKNNARYIQRISSITPFMLQHGTPFYVHASEYGVCNLRPTFKNAAFSFNRFYMFDEERGLAWEEKVRQQKRAYKKILKVYFKYVLSQYCIRYVPFYVYWIISTQIDSFFGHWLFQVLMPLRPLFYRRRRNAA